MSRTHAGLRALLSLAVVLAAPLAARAQDAGAPPATDGGTATDTTTGTTGTTPPNNPQCGVGGGGAAWSDVDAGPSPFASAQHQRITDDRPPPTAEQIAALQQMEAEVARFQRLGTSYRDTVTAIVRREYLQQRRSRDEGYARQIRVEEEAQDEARENAIRLFERFIARYPNDATYTPDAMFRLGELYYERSANQFQDAVEAANNARAAEQADGGTGEDIPDPQKDFTPTINLYRTIATTFPSYRHIDGVLYLIGYCLNEMNQVEESMSAWRHLVCANRYTYDPTAPVVVAGTEDGGTQADGGFASQTLGADAGGLMADNAPYTDPYSDCQPILQGTEFFGEVWLRIGEYHFDNDFTTHGLDRAIAAYTRVLSNPEDRNYNLALYKIAWSYYRASRYPEALHSFEQLVQWSDDEERRTGHAGTELRQEAIQYIGLTFAYDDWNENQTPDPQEGQPTGFTRAQDPNLLPQDRPWTYEVYNQLAQVYFDEAKFYEAIEVWKFILQKWPLAAQAPEINHMISRAYRRHAQAPDPGHPEQAVADQEAATTYDAYQANYGIGTTWYNQNNDHPEEQRRAEELAEGTIINAAITYHQRAQNLRAQASALAGSGNPRDQAQAVELLRQAKEQYRLAGTAYRAYISRYPNNPQAYELNYNLADALYFSENYEEAAVEYAHVRDSNLDDSHLGEAARRIVECYKRILDQQVANHQVELRTAPPDPQCTPPQVLPLPLPDALQKVATARDRYLHVVDAAHDTEHVRDGYDYNNALLLYLYGYWPQAHDAFTRIFDERCSGPNANETGQVAWTNLRNMAVALNQTDEVERLAHVLQERNCTFTAGGTATGTACTSNTQCTAPLTCMAGHCNIDCHVAANHDDPRCIIVTDINAAQYRHALEVFAQAEHATGDEQVRLYEQAATMLVDAVNRVPDDPQAPLALERAAIALQRANRFESAIRLYQRIIDDVGPRHAADATEQASFDNMVSNAYFQLAYSANKNFDYDRAIQNYRVLTDNARFANSTEARIVQRREDALVNVAQILVFQQQYPQAAQYYQRLATASHDATTVRLAYYNVAEMSYKQRNWNNTVRDMQSFIDRYRNVAGSGDLLVQAQWRIVEARRNQHNAHALTQALQDTVDMFARVGGQPGSLSAEYAAQAKFELVDAGSHGFESFAITGGHPATMSAYAQGVASQIATGATQAKNLAATYDPIAGYRRPTWTIAAFVRQGRVYELLAKAIQNTPFVIPADMARQMRGLPRDAQTTIHDQVQDQIHQQVLDPKTTQIECLAVARYALAARAARAGSIDTDETRFAISRLAAYGEERIAECVTSAHATDASFELAQPGEFSRASSGSTMTIPPDIGPPPLAPEDQ